MQCSSGEIKFNTRMQSAEECIDQFVTALRLIAKDCGFKLLKDDLIRDRIVCGTSSEMVNVHLLWEQDLTLDKAINICCSTEKSKKQLQSICVDNADPNIHVVIPVPADSEEKSNMTHGKRDIYWNCRLLCGVEEMPWFCFAIQTRKEINIAGTLSRAYIVDSGWLDEGRVNLCC